MARPVLLLPHVHLRRDRDLLRLSDDPGGPHDGERPAPNPRPAGHARAGAEHLPDDQFRGAADRGHPDRSRGGPLHPGGGRPTERGPDGRRGRRLGWPSIRPPLLGGATGDDRRGGATIAIAVSHCP